MKGRRKLLINYMALIFLITWSMYILAKTFGLWFASRNLTEADRIYLFSGPFFILPAGMLTLLDAEIGGLLLIIGGAISFYAGLKSIIGNNCPNTMTLSGTMLLFGLLLFLTDVPGSAKYIHGRMKIVYKSKLKLITVALTTTVLAIPLSYLSGLVLGEAWSELLLTPQNGNSFWGLMIFYSCFFLGVIAVFIFIEIVGLRLCALILDEKNENT